MGLSNSKNFDSKRYVRSHRNNIEVRAARVGRRTGEGDGEAGVGEMKSQRQGRGRGGGSAPRASLALLAA